MEEAATLPLGRRPFVVAQLDVHYELELLLDLGGSRTVLFGKSISGALSFDWLFLIESIRLFPVKLNPLKSTVS